MRFHLALLAAPLIAAGCASHPLAVSTPASFGVLVMAHGGSAEWNRALLESISPLTQRYPTEVAFGMADASALQQSVHNLEGHGVRHIAVIRVFVSGESWKERTAQILGIEPGAPPAPSPATSSAHAQHGDDHSGDHQMAFYRIPSKASFAMSDEGLMDAPQMGTVLAERAATLNRCPETEDVLILAHGPEEEDENARWLTKLDARAQAVRDSRPFRRVQVETLREDWPDKRVAAEERVRAFVERAHVQHGTAIVIPFRVEGFGPYADVLQGLEYVSDGKGLLPAPEVSLWLREQAEELRRREW